MGRQPDKTYLKKVSFSDMKSIWAKGIAPTESNQSYEIEWTLIKWITPWLFIKTTSCLIKIWTIRCIILLMPICSDLSSGVNEFWSYAMCLPISFNYTPLVKAPIGNDLPSASKGSSCHLFAIGSHCILNLCCWLVIIHWHIFVLDSGWILNLCQWLTLNNKWYQFTIGSRCILTCTAWQHWVTISGQYI
jgi:hypothetical protein